MSDEFLYMLAGEVESKFATAETSRLSSIEERWSRAYHNYRGVYYKDVHFTEHEKSRVFVKVTKTKVLAAYGRIIDVVFQNGNLPIGVSKTDVPRKKIVEALENPEMPGPMAAPPAPVVNPFDVGYAGDERGKVGAKFGNMQPSPALSAPQEMPPQAVEEPNYVQAARNMERLIHDQIADSKGQVAVRDAIFESCLLGTGIIKGPFNYTKLVNSWENGELRQEQERVPHIEFVSIWDFYPDPEATCMQDAEWVIQRHKLSRTQLEALAEQPHFNSEAIYELTRYTDGNSEQTSRDNEVQAEGEKNTDAGQQSRWDIYEYWGPVDSSMIPSELLGGPSGDEPNQVQVNVWVSGGKVIRLALNPFEPQRIPYLSFPYEKNPYSFWGVGVGENMDDMQSMMNGTARMAIDNLALAGNMVFDIDESALVPGEDDTIYPGKKFRRQSGVPGQSIYGIKFPNTATENMMLFDRWRQLSDESTGIPSYSHGNTGVTGMTRTASGMSMLMGAADLNTKTAIKNMDDFLFQPLAQYYFYWNKQFYEGDLDIEGDLEVKATGTQSLIAKEVKSQRLLTFLQLASNPQVAPMINIKNVVEDLAHTLDADAKRYINDLDAARQQAEIVGLQNAQAQAQAEGLAEGSTGTGDGNIGIGQAAQPGEEEFSSNE